MLVEGGEGGRQPKAGKGGPALAKAVVQRLWRPAGERDCLHVQLCVCVCNASRRHLPTMCDTPRRESGDALRVLKCGFRGELSRAPSPVQGEGESQPNQPAQLFIVVAWQSVW
jgi:hypothetical protein